MRSLATMTLFLAAAFLLPVAAAAQTPGGTYQQTCRDVKVHGSSLHAKCKDTHGNWQTTELQNYQQCSSDIQNINGQLQCQKGGNNGVPGGSYSQTCQNITVSGNTLHASCQKKNGKMKDTSLKNFGSCRDIANDNGKLRCK